MSKRAMSKRISSQSLGTLIALALGTFSIIALLLTSIPQLWSNVQTQEDAITNYQQLVAQDAARTVNSFTEQRLRSLEIASRLTNLPAETQQSQSEILQRLLGDDITFMRLILLKSDGQIMAEASRRSLATAEKLDEDRLKVLLAQINQGQTYISDVFIDTVTSEPEILVAIPVKDILDRPSGALAAIINLKFMWKLVDELDTDEGGEVYVVDRQGNLLASRDTARVLAGENLAHIHIVHDFLNGSYDHDTDEIDHYSGIMGNDVVGSYVALGTPDWAVMAEMPRAIAYRSVINNMILAVVSVVGAAILASGLGYYLSKRLTSPLVKLMDTARRIADGEHELQASTQGTREVAALAQAFNMMTGQLRATVEGLEESVEQRTADLQTALVEVETRSHEQSRLLAELEEQRQVIQELSVPVLPVSKQILVMPLIGAIDSERLVSIQERALHSIEQTRAHYLLLDITGVPIVDSQVAQGLVSLARMTSMLGCQMTLIGIRPEVAQSIVGLGLDLRAIQTAADLQAALRTRTAEKDLQSVLFSTAQQ